MLPASLHTTRQDALPRVALETSEPRESELPIASGALVAARIPAAPEAFTRTFAAQRLPRPLVIMPAKRVSTRPAGLIASDISCEALERHWHRLTGRAAHDSPFTLVVPVHNEARLLPATLYALSRSNIPPTTPLQVVFVTNASTDGSAAVIDRRLQRLYSFGNIHTPRAVRAIDSTAATAKATFGSISIMHVTTPTPGKSNALNIGDAIARERDHKITLCVDADTFVEPDTIGRLYADAVRHRVGEEDSDVVVVAGSVQFALPRAAQKPARLIRPAVQAATESVTQPRPGHIWGSVWAWSPNWMFSHAGHPKSVSEDLVTAARAFLSGKRVEMSSATTWAFYPTTFVDYGKQQSRFARGLHQLRSEVGGEKFATLREFLAEWYWTPHSTLARVRHIFIPELKRTPLRAWPRAMLGFGIEELWRHRGARQFRKAPLSSTWDRVASTK